MQDGEMVSFAISNGEGTLIDYGTVSITNLFLVLNVHMADISDMTVITGPADGTGE